MLLTMSVQTDYSFNLNFSRPAHPILAQMFNCKLLHLSTALHSGIISQETDVHLNPVINLGFAGYRRIMQNNLSKARLISRALEGSGYYVCLSNIHRAKDTGAVPSISGAAEQLAVKAGDLVKGKQTFNEADCEFYNEGLPVVSFRSTDEFKKQYPHVKQQWVQLQLRAIGWIVPKYVSEERRQLQYADRDPSYPLAPNCEDIEILRVVVRESLSGDLAGRLIGDILQV